MTVGQFSVATGYNYAYVQSQCRNGTLTCTMVNGRYDIPTSEVPVWRARRNKRMGRSEATIHNSSVAYQSALDEYNRKQGKDYSYGQAVMLGLIE